MPDKLVRKQNLIDYSIKNGIPVSEKDIELIVSETKEYSFTGYEFFGRKEEIKKLMLFFKQGDLVNKTTDPHNLSYNSSQKS